MNTTNKIKEKKEKEPEQKYEYFPFGVWGVRWEAVSGDRQQFAQYPTAHNPSQATYIAFTCGGDDDDDDDIHDDKFGQQLIVFQLSKQLEIAII